VSFFETLLPEDLKKAEESELLNKKLFLASYDLSFRIAKAGKTHSIGENLLKPAIISTVDTILGKATGGEYI
jgi:hypothetical protein